MMKEESDEQGISKQFMQFQELLKCETRKTVSPRDAVFHRDYAKNRHRPFTEDQSRTWISILMREGLTDNTREKIFPSRFDLGNIQTDDKRTDSLKELLVDIYPIPKNEKKGEKLARKDTREFENTLEFIRKITSREIDTSSKELPLIDLRVINLLYRMNKARKGNIFGTIEPPHSSGKPTMEVQTTGASPRNVRGFEIVNDLLSYLSVEISDSKLHHVETSLLTASKLLACIEIENREILEPIYSLHMGDHAVIARTLAHMTKAIDRYPVGRRTSTTPLDEAIYTYLRTLPFLHFVGEYKNIVDNTRLMDTAAPISTKIEEFCAKLGAAHNEEIHPNTPVTSIEEFPSFIEHNVRDLIKLVQAATGLPTQRRDLFVNIDYSKKVLNMYVFHQNGKMPLQATTLSVSDCIAALCTTRYQQAVKTNYTPYWYAQDSADIDTRLFGQMEKGRSIKDLYQEDYIPHGISQLLYSRFCRFHAQLIGQQDRLEAALAFQIARLDKYAECLLLNDIDHVNAAIAKFNDYCAQQALLLTHPAFQPPFIDSMNLWLNRDGV